MEISKVEIPADNKVVVTGKLTDGLGNIIKNASLDNNSLRFGISKVVTDQASGVSKFESLLIIDRAGADYVEAGTTKKAALPTTKQATMDVGGKLTETDAGFTYVFTNTLAANYDKAATYVVGGQATRLSRTYVANTSFWFVPNGGTAAKREVVKTEACNTCHDRIEGHGGQRYAVDVCVTCHTDQTTDPETGQTVDLRVMIHKIHDGRNLPSVVRGKTPYKIVGNAQSVHDYSDALLPQDVRNCTACHQGAQANNFKTVPSIAACGSCHDGIDWATGKAKFEGGKNHPAGAQKDDSACKTCHKPDGDEFDESVAGSHTIPAKSKQLKGLVYTIDAATAKAGENPTVEFTVKNTAGTALDANKLDFIEVVLAYPTPDYSTSIREMINQITVPPAAPFARAGKLEDLGGGKFRYTFAAKLDPSWKGSVGIGMAAYYNTTIKGNDGKDVVVREGNINPVTYVNLDGGRAAPRRTVVDIKNCNQCHGNLGNPGDFSVHGGIRRNPQYCDMCHNPNATDEAARPKDQGAPESIHLKYMIHSLHMGKERDVPTDFYGRAAARTEEIGFPTAGGQRNCLKCHTGTTNRLPLSAAALPTTITQGGKVIRVMQPIAATCTGCHASKPAQAHIELQTSAAGVETCTLCHGAGRDFAVEKVHAEQ